MKGPIQNKVTEMMSTSMNKLPLAAIDYLKYLSSTQGFCGEICVTAYAYYCQAILGMKCSDPSYKITKEAKQWFEENKDLNKYMGNITPDDFPKRS